jgi:phosphomannomutase
MKELSIAQQQQSLQSLERIVRKYDIRGTNITQQDAIVLGLALKHHLKHHLKHYHKNILFITAYDTRTTSSSLCEGLHHAFNDVDVIDVGVGSTPYMYFATLYYKAQMGIMVTASHNPLDYTGFKLLIDSKAPDQQKILQIFNDYKKYITTHIYDCQALNSKILKKNLYNEYIDYLLLQSKWKDNNITVLWDCNNGGTGPITSLLAQRLNHSIINNSSILLQQPDPTLPDNIEKLKQNACDIAIGLDGDGDRIVMICKNQVLYGHDILANLAAQMEGGTIVVDVKVPFDTVEELNRFHVIVSPTGHSIIKDTMLKHQAVLGGEMSGHIFLPMDSEYFGFNGYLACDDAILIGLILIQLHSSQPLINEKNKVFFEKRIKVDNQYDFINTIKNKVLYSIDIDGVKVRTQDGFWLVRSSNTEDVLVICYYTIPNSTEELVIKRFFAEMGLNI